MSKQVENYLFQEVLGNGQYGQVFKGHNIKTDEIVAIKQMNIEKFKKLPKLYDFIKNEIDILSQINHAHVIRFIEILRTTNNFYLIYEYCNGGDLERLLKKRKFLPDKEATDILRQILSAFKVLVSKNILHRDLKPGNIIFHNNQVKVADFGFCKILEGPQQMTKTMVGSPIYMAPEILKGYNYSVKADIWSIGVVFFEMLFGFCPFEDSTIQRLIKQIDQKPLFFPKNINNISKLSEELLKKMLVVDPHKRIEWNQLMQMMLPETPTILSNLSLPETNHSGMRTPVTEHKNGNTPYNRSQTNHSRDNKHLSRGKPMRQESPKKIETRQNRTTSVGVPQRQPEYKIMEQRRITQNADAFKQNLIQTPKAYYNVQKEDNSVRQLMYDRYKVMFLVSLMKLCMDTSINDLSFKVAFYILSKAKTTLASLIQAMQKVKNNTQEFQNLQRILLDEERKIQGFYMFFQSELKNEAISIDVVSKYLLDLKVYVFEAKDKQKILIFMKYLCELFNFEQFGQNNLNDFCNMINKMTMSQLQQDVWDFIDNQMQIIQA